jgi:hypothetical protein
MFKKSVVSLIALSLVMIAAAPASAALINLVVNGTVSSNALTNSNSPYVGVPVGTAVTLTVPIDTLSTGFTSPDETLYNITRTNCTINVAGVGTANGTNGVSTMQYDDGGAGFYMIRPPSIAVPGGFQNQSSVNFRVSGEAGPNPFVNTNPADIFASHGTYNNPSAAVFDGPVSSFPSGGLDFYVSVLNNSFQTQRMSMTINSFTITPEPTSLGLLAVAGMMTIVRRRRA